MAGRLTTIFSKLSGCYYVTRNIFQSLCFAFRLGRKKKIVIRINNNLIHLRKNETDQAVFNSTFLEKYHRSPVDLGPSPVIVDLGSNIGLTMVDFKQNYPSARIIGVEMDKDNFDLCNMNISGLTGCTLIHAAVWNENGYINYKGIDEQSYAIEKESFGNSGLVRCMTMDRLFKENNILEVDYINMDIEGAEKALLLESPTKTWLKQVKYLSIEVHDWIGTENKFLVKNLKTELEANEFIVFKSAIHISSLFAINKLLISS